VADNGSYPFPTPDWLTSNASWVATETDLYYKSRQGKWTNPHDKPNEELTTALQVLSQFRILVEV
jgi:hypothetical protein